MPYPATAIANEFIELSGGKSLSPMKLMKLVYFAHGWYLALTGKPLIQERIEAWQFGPVIPRLYQDFKQYGSGDITQPTLEFRFSNGRTGFHETRVHEGEDPAENEEALDVIHQVWEIYGKHSATKLSNATHMQGTPWSAIYREGARSLVIPNELIGQYFQSLQPQ